MLLKRWLWETNKTFGTKRNSINRISDHIIWWQKTKMGKFKDPKTLWEPPTTNILEVVKWPKLKVEELLAPQISEVYSSLKPSLLRLKPTKIFKSHLYIIYSKCDNSVNTKNRLPQYMYSF